MAYIDTERFRREMERSYQTGSLSNNAREMLENLNLTISKTFKSDLGKELKEQIRKECLDRMIQNWKGFYEAKKPILSYFTDLCKQNYSGMYRRMKT